MDAGIEPGTDEVQPALLRRRDLQDHVRMVAGELRELRCEHHSGRQARCHQPDAAGRTVAKQGDLIERCTDVAQCWNETREELRSSFGGGYAARGPRQQTDTKPLFESPHRMAERRRRHAEPLAGSSKAAFLSHRQDRRQDAELITHHS